MTCGSHKALTPTTVFRKCGIDTVSGKQECCIPKNPFGAALSDSSNVFSVVIVVARYIVIFDLFVGLTTAWS